MAATCLLATTAMRLVPPMEALSPPEDMAEVILQGRLMEDMESMTHPEMDTLLVAMVLPSRAMDAHRMRALTGDNTARRVEDMVSPKAMVRLRRTMALHMPAEVIVLPKVIPQAAMVPLTLLKPVMVRLNNLLDVNIRDTITTEAITTVSLTRFQVQQLTDRSQVIISMENSLVMVKLIASTTRAASQRILVACL